MIAFLMVIDDQYSRNFLEELYLRYHKQMYCFANNILNNSHDAEDAVQMSIIKLANHLDKINNMECNKTKSLIVTIIRCTSIDLYRQKKIHPFELLEDDQEIFDDEAETLDDIMIRLGEAEWLSKKLTELNEDYSEILTLKYYHDFKDFEIAQLLGINQNNARIRLFRAKRALRKLIQHDPHVEIEREFVYES